MTAQSHPRNLAELKRALARPGAVVIGVENEILADMPERMEAFRSPRPVAKVQGNGFYLRQPDGSRSWMEFGRAADWTFGDETFSRRLPRGVIAYRLAPLPHPQKDEG